ncbi:myb-like protein X isoform X2 [Durio zibethinus]|uniref:Myb-like protein X isoform X2 n=1 Tax=Durio zibethinus TaxID=66656 RepID=A0A6P5X393_DURZI|nr:myb-like protein X isoform X2 [Durio zibethinus]
MGNEMGNNNTSGLRQEDYSAQEKSQQEVAHADDLKGQNHLVPATQDLNSDDQKTDDKEEDDMTTEGKKSLQDDDKGQNHEDIYVNEKETGLASINQEGEAELHDDNRNQDEKEQDYNMTPEAKEKSLQEAAYADEAEEQDHLVPSAEDKSTNGNETELASSEPDGMASSNVENQKQDEKEKENSTKAEEIPLQEAASTVETNAEAHIVPPAGDESTHGIETGLVSSDHDGRACPSVDNQKQDEKEEDFNINDEAKEKSSQEAASKDVVERQDHLLPAFEDKNSHGNETGLISSDPEGTDPHCDNRKQQEKDEDNTDAELLPKDDHEDDIEEKNLTIPTAEEQGRTELHPPDESTKVEEKPSEAFNEGCETQPASSSKNLGDHEIQKESSFRENLSGTRHHFENQNSMMKEDEGTRNAIPDAASSTSDDSVPQEPAVLEPEEHELAKIHTKQLVQVCNGPLQSEEMIIPSLTCQDQENGFILDSSISTDMVESPDPSLEVEKERDDFLVKEMAAKKVASEEKFELKDGDEVGNYHLGNITTITTDLPNGVGAKCNEEFPSEMNSMKNDSPESQLEAYLSGETLKFLVEVSKTEEKGIVLSQKATLVKKESENEYSKYFHLQIQSGEESIEKLDVQGSEEGSNIDEQNASPPQFVMNGCQNEEKRCLLEQQKDTQKVQLVTDPAVISADIFLTDQKYNEEDSEEKKMVEAMDKKIEDSKPIGNDTPSRENEVQFISRSHPIEQAEAFFSPSPFLHVLTEKKKHDSYAECKKVQNSNESMAEVIQESSGEYSTTEASSFANQNLTEKNVVSIVELTGQKPLWDLSECPKPTAVIMAETMPSLKQSSQQCAIVETPAIANGEYYQQESVGRFSTESNPDNMSIHAQMRKSPSFDLDLRNDARAEESDQTPLLYQDKTTIESFSGQADVADPGKPVANTEYGKNSSQYEAMPVEEKVVTLETSDSEKSKTPFPGFSKEEEEADQMLISPKKGDNQSTAKKTTKVSAKEVTSSSTKGKGKRKPRTSLFGTCMCCATVIN